MENCRFGFDKQRYIPWTLTVLLRCVHIYLCEIADKRQTRRAIKPRNRSLVTDEFMDYHVQRWNDECSYSELLQGRSKAPNSKTVITTVNAMIEISQINQYRRKPVMRILRTVRPHFI